jgi:hypothetical protein
MGAGSLATVYDLTAAGQHAFTADRRLGFSGAEHGFCFGGFCFGEFRVARVVRADLGPFCRRSLPDSGPVESYSCKRVCSERVNDARRHGRRLAGDVLAVRGQRAVNPPFASGFVCVRRSPEPGCAVCRDEGRRRASVALCDGPAKPGPSGRRSATCDRRLCGSHRVRVGANRDLCPQCAAGALATGTATLAGEPDDELATLREDGAPLTLFDVAVPPHVPRIR